MTTLAPTPDAFRHEALLYSGDSEFFAATAAFVREGLAAAEPVLVVVAPVKIEGLRAWLGTDAAERVRFADMDVVGANPARIIPAWQAFVDEHGGRGGALRGIGEPVAGDLSEAALVECLHHEALVNVAFEESPPWWLLCPYDRASLRAEVIEHAERSHPLLWDGHRHRVSPHCEGIAHVAPPAESLPEPSVAQVHFPFDAGTLTEVRAFVHRTAAEMGLSRDRATDLAIAAHEAATNSVRHGGGSGAARMWREDQTREEQMVVCEVRDSGRIVDPLVGRVRPDVDQAGGRGLWIVNQLCDLSQVRTSASGTVVRMSMMLLRSDRA